MPKIIKRTFSKISEGRPHDFLKSNSQSLFINTKTVGKYVADSHSERVPTSNNRTEKNFLPKGAKKVHRTPRQIAAILTLALSSARLIFV